MPLARSGYELHFEDISGGQPLLGSAAVVPWDTEIFGFPVAYYRIGAQRLDPSVRSALQERFLAWAQRNNISVCACAIPAANLSWKLYLPEIGFRFVDVSMEAALQELGTATLPNLHSGLRMAEPADWSSVESLAARSFGHGRYHADPLFPRELADRRYTEWVRRALRAGNRADRVYVMGDPGVVQCFYQATVVGENADIRLNAIAPELQGKGLGADLYASVLHLLKGVGVRRVVTSISAANTAAVNIYSKLGFRFSNAELIYHWHLSGGRAAS